MALFAQGFLSNRNSRNNPMPPDRWFALCENVGLDGRAGWAALAEAYGGPARAYHNMNHIGDCLMRFGEHAHLVEDPVAVEFAIWFHDIVYDTRAADNEERSAVIAAEFLSGTPLGTVVANLIRATKHDAPPPTRDAALLCDIDLSILGREPAEYDAYNFKHLRKTRHTHNPVDDARGNAEALLEMRDGMELRIRL